MTREPIHPMTRLHEREHQLRAEIDAAENAWREGLAPAPHEVQDRKDQASDQADAGTRAAELERDRTELREVQAALRQLAEGRYGACTDCGEIIAEARLQAQPQALRCAACQQRREQHHGL